MDRLEASVDWIQTAPLEDVRDATQLADALGRAGLFFDERDIYGSDARYMLPSRDMGGMWQTPRQLAAYLLYLENVETYLDVGTFTGWTVTLVAAYLRRVAGLRRCDTLDVEELCPIGVRNMWRRKGLPIRYVVAPDRDALVREASPTYDVVFIDADHSFEGVCADYAAYGARATSHVAFHDVNDVYCADGVGRLWASIGNKREFTDHPDGRRIMGIGVTTATTWPPASAGRPDRSPGTARDAARPARQAGGAPPGSAR